MNRIYKKNYIIDKLNTYEELGCKFSHEYDNEAFIKAYDWMLDEHGLNKLKLKLYRIENQDHIILYEECCFINDDSIGCIQIYDKDEKILSGIIHDEIISVIESPYGQENRFAIVTKWGKVYDFEITNK